MVFLLCCAGINDIDVSAADYFKSYLNELYRRYPDEIIIVLTDIKIKVKKILTKSHIIQNTNPIKANSNRYLIPAMNVFWDITHAVDKWVEHNDKFISDSSYKLP